MSLDSFGLLRETTINVSGLVEWHITAILTQLRRQIKTRQSNWHPWQINISRLINDKVFWEAYRAIRDFRSNFGYRIVQERFRNGKLKKIIITFHHSGAFKYYMLQLCNGNIAVGNFLKRDLPHGIKGKILITQEKPLIFTYITSSSLCKVTAYYEIVNEYGTVVSF